MAETAQFPALELPLFRSEWRIERHLDEAAVSRQILAARAEVKYAIKNWWVENKNNITELEIEEIKLAVSALARSKVELVFSFDREDLEDELDSKTRMIFAEEASKVIERLTCGEVKNAFLQTKIQKIAGGLV